MVSIIREKEKKLINNVFILGDITVMKIINSKLLNLY